MVKTRDRRVVYGERLSDNISIDTNGQLIAHNVVIARTGTQQYYGREFTKDEPPNEIFNIDRLPKYVFDPEFIASFENAPFVHIHPNDDVTVDNYKQLAKGFVKDVTKGRMKLHGLDDRFYDEDGNNVLYADIVVTDKQTIDFIKGELKKEPKDREIDVSCGYDAIYHKVADDRYVQIGQNGNHVALVPSGRAKVAKIRDAAISIEHDNPYFFEKLPFEYEGGLKQRGVSGYTLEIMTPQQYYDELVYKAKTHYINDVEPSDDERINWMLTEMGAGKKFDIPYIVYCTEGDNYQDGRHRVEAAKRMGVQKIPVLIFYQSKEDEMVEVVRDAEGKKETEDAVVSKKHKGYTIKSDDLEEFMITKNGKYVTLVKAESFDEVKKLIDAGKIKTKDYKFKFNDVSLTMHGFDSKQEAREFALIVHENFE